MSTVEDFDNRTTNAADRFRDLCARRLGVSDTHKAAIYAQIYRSASLRDVTYWLQVFFSAGIATLGLVLNSPAVIIGAMLISPLMNPILAGGLALAAGDLILGVRALLTLVLSCLLAGGFALLLVALLPFKEVTPEIAARTHPNTLDLVVALFSGAIGAIATCKEVKGVVTSIPGVAIAVALMPPLCVAGYGAGVALSLDGAEGWQVARGGGLLFLTNLCAIMFVAGLVFLLVRLDTAEVRAHIGEVRKSEPMSLWLRDMLMRRPGLARMRMIGSLPSRLLLAIVTLLLLLVPLGRSYNQLRDELAAQATQNRIRRTATELWQERFAELPSGAPRSHLGLLTIDEAGDSTTLLMRVFTSQPYTASEQTEFRQLVAARLARDPETIALDLIEIPTTSQRVAERADGERAVDATAVVTGDARPAQTRTIRQLQESLLTRVEGALAAMRLPAPAELVDHRVTVGTNASLVVDLHYLSERDISPDAAALIGDNVRERLGFPTAGVNLTRIDSVPEPLAFNRGQTTLTPQSLAVLEPLGVALREHPNLRVRIDCDSARGEAETLAAERTRAVAEMLNARWQVAPERIETNAAEESSAASPSRPIASLTLLASPAGVAPVAAR